MRLTRRDVAATFLVAAIVVPYVGYLVRGTMPFIQDPRGMSGVGLVLGLAAFGVGRWRDLLRTGPWHRDFVALGVLTLVIGIAALAAAETWVAEGLLAAFIGMIVVFWAFATARHAGLVHDRTGSGMAHA